MKAPLDTSEFEIDETRVLGRGALGVLCRGRRLSDRQEVAVRLLPEDLAADPDFALRFPHEMAAIALLKGESFVSVLGAGTLKGRLFFATELVEGEALSRHLAKGARFTTEDILHVAQGIGEALQAASRCKIFHGRLRPSSIFLSSDGRVRVADLGLSKVFPVAPSSRWLGAGEKYLSPEQAGGRGPDSRSDVYTLGAILYELATGRPPFEGHASTTSLHFQLLHVEPTAPHEAGSTVPREVERLILGCLAKEPENRYSSPDDFLKDLEGVRGALRAAHSPSTPEETDTGDFVIEEDHVIGEGGMGTLYLGRQRSLGRTVAVKVIRPLLLLEPDLVSRFRREAELLAQVNDGNVVQVFGTGVWKGRLFYAMELVEGSDLSTLLGEGRRFPEGEILRVAEGVARALRAAWKYRIVHRDIKPSNILITREGVVKVADFGLAKSLRVGGDASTCILGTLAYLSPEQGMGLAVDVRSDIYSLGVVLYELAKGNPPFGPGSVDSVIYHHVHAAPPSLQSVASISGGLKRLIHRCLSKELGDRYQTPDDLLLELLAIGKDPAPGPASPAAGAFGAKKTGKSRRASSPSSWKKAFALSLSLGDYGGATKLAEEHGGTRSLEYRRARGLHEDAELRELERRGMERVRAGDWAGAAALYQERVEGSGSRLKAGRALALECCRDLAHAAELERKGDWGKALAVYRKYADLDPGPTGYVRDHLAAALKRSKIERCVNAESRPSSAGKAGPAP